jgi:thiol-disulfide isomerase/thioredoxin
MITKKNRFIPIFIIAFALGGKLSYAQELKFKTIESEKDWISTKSDALGSGKIIFLDIYATWCGPCKKMDAEVYTNAAVSEYFGSNFVNLKVDGETEFGRVLASKYSLTGYPSLYFINPDEELVNVLVGYRDSEAFLASGQQIKDFGKRYTELNTLYKSSGLSGTQTSEFIDLLAMFGKKDLLTVLAGTKVKTFTEADVLNPVNKPLVLAVVSEIDSFPASIVMKNAAALKTLWGPEDLSQYLSGAFDVTMRKAIELADSTLMGRIAEQLIPVYMMDNPDRIKEAKLTTQKIYFTGTGSWPDYIKAVEYYYEKYEYGNVRFLYAESYYIIENQLNSQVLFDKSMEWVEKVISAKPDFESYFLAAIINTYRSDNTAAVLWMNKAESLAVSEDEKASLVELKKYLDSQ